MTIHNNRITMAYTYQNMKNDFRSDIYEQFKFLYIDVYSYYTLHIKLFTRKIVNKL